MFSYAISSATSYFHLPIDEDEDKDIEAYERKCLTWVAEPSSCGVEAAESTIPSSPRLSPPFASRKPDSALIKRILATDDLYDILGIESSAALDRGVLRRAYLSRSKACHPDKFPNSPDATLAFQKVATAYDILSKPSSKRMYDTRTSTSFDFWAAHPPPNAEETFRSVAIGILNDFLDGDLEVIRTLLKAVNDLNPGLHLGDDGINMLLESVRERALTCRTCVYALQDELARLSELQHAFRQMSYFNVVGRTRVTIQLTRVTLSLPVVLERAVLQQDPSYDPDAPSNRALLPRPVSSLIRRVDYVLDKMERMVKS
ncbi:hypothetical protein BD626DRAFT_490456 [Schizophyllum amplum]|uniref:J domain-containing protein n=1 Tax=Schizophyllum amplum TaxID=97359 RepID=A0A550CJJ3_9AGAR|nr:hypothetical protein BD626DRAFT_490456 [Auriculariopsis ampla]